MSEGILTVYILVVMFLASRLNEELNSTTIFEGVLIFLLIKQLIIYSSYGVSEYFFMSIVFAKIISVFQLEEIRMISLSV